MENKAANWALFGMGLVDVGIGRQESMIAHLDRPTVLAGAVLGTALTGGMSGETIQSIALVTSAVAAIVGALTWLDKRVESKINKHANEEAVLQDARLETLKAEIRAMLAEHAAEHPKRK